jgi:hypothetical protein
MQNDETPPANPVHDLVLLPCPFCGEAPRRFTSPTWRYSVECVGCDIRKQGMTAQESADKWNRRHVDQWNAAARECMASILTAQKMTDIDALKKAVNGMKILLGQ